MHPRVATFQTHKFSRRELSHTTGSLNVRNLRPPQKARYFLLTANSAQPIMLIKRNFRPVRRSPRQWWNTSVQVFAGPAHLDGIGINLSDGGMCLFTIANLPVGTQLELEFLAPQAEQPVRVSGKVRHRALYLYGIEFLADTQSEDPRAARGEMAAS